MLGLTSISEQPIATEDFSGNVTLGCNSQSTNSIDWFFYCIKWSISSPTGEGLTVGFGALTITGDANVTPDPTPLTVGVGTITVSAAANVSVTGNQLTVSSGTVTITAAANVEPDATPLTLNVTSPGIITWNDIDPGASQVWVPIEPY